MYAGGVPAQDTNEPNDNDELDQADESQSPGYGSIAKNVRAAVAYLTEKGYFLQFTVNDVINSCAALRLPAPKGQPCQGF